MKNSGVNTLKGLFNQLFNVATTGNLPELIVSAVLNMLGIGITVNALFKKDYDTVVSILQKIFDTMGDGADPEGAYAGIAKALDEMSGGTWSGTVGGPSDPSDPATPTNPTNPTNPTDPTTPTSPTNPTSPTTPTVPVQPTQPTTAPQGGSITQTTGESLNFFQRLIKAIREFFQRLFSFGR